MRVCIVWASGSSKTYVIILVFGIVKPTIRPWFPNDLGTYGDVPLISFIQRRKVPWHSALARMAWRLLMFQKNSALAQWIRARTENARGTRKTMIVAWARKLLIALWRLVREGVVPDGVVLRPTQ